MLKFFLFLLTAGGFFLFGAFLVVFYPYFWLTGFKENEVRFFFYFLSRYTMFVIKTGSKSFVVEGEIPPGAGIIVSNHSSILDILCFSSFGVNDAVLLAKDWPFKVPVMGRYARAMGNIALADLEEVKAQAKAAFGKGLKLIVFPEGTRSSGGQVQRFHSGAFMLAGEFNVPVIPVAIKGLGQTIPKNKVLIQSVDIKMCALPPVLPFEKSDSSALKMAQYVKSLIKEKLSEI